MHKKFHLNGKEINLTGDDITIQSNKFNVDKQGNMTCGNANITGGEINLTGNETTPKFKVTHNNNTNMYSTIFPQQITTEKNGNSIGINSALGYGMFSIQTDGITTVAITGKANNPFLFLKNNVGGYGELSVNNKDLEISSNYSTIAKITDYFIIKNSSGDEIIAFGNSGIYPHRTIDMQGENIINAGNVSSDRRLKKDIQDTEISAIDRIMQIQHKQFAWKKDSAKEDIGYIAQELEQIDANYVRHNITKDEQGNVTSDMYEVRILPLLSTATKAIQEQQKIIEELKNRIEKLESDKKG